jgi:hypothetical protein
MGGVLRIHLLVSEVRYWLSSPRYQVSGHQELDGYGYEKGGMAKTSVEGQGPSWAVEPVMMMMIVCRVASGEFRQYSDQLRNGSPGLSSQQFSLHHGVQTRPCGPRSLLTGTENTFLG